MNDSWSRLCRRSVCGVWCVFVCVCGCGHVIDINECSTGLGPCGTSVTSVSCNNTDGSYICICQTGYHFTNGACQGNVWLVIMAALRSRCGHYIFILWFLLLFSSFFPRLISAVTDWMSTILPHMVWPSCEFKMQVWNVLHTARWRYRTQKKSPKIRHLGTIAQLCGAISSQLRHASTIEKNLLNSNISPICPHNMLNFGPLTAEIRSRVSGTPAHFNGFRVLAALLHGTLVVGVSQTLRHW